MTASVFCFLILLQCHRVSGSFRATQREETWNAERMTLASQHGWADCEGDIRREEKKKKKTPFNVFFFFFHVRAVKHPRRSGYYFNEGCGWINTAPAQWCVAAESVTSSRKQIHIQQTGFVFFVFFLFPSYYENDGFLVVGVRRTRCAAVTNQTYESRCQGGGKRSARSLRDISTEGSLTSEYNLATWKCARQDSFCAENKWTHLW